MWVYGLDWSDPGYRWQTFVSAVMKFGFREMRVIS